MHEIDFKITIQMTFQRTYPLTNSGCELTVWQGDFWSCRRHWKEQGRALEERRDRPCLCLSDCPPLDPVDFPLWTELRLNKIRFSCAMLFLLTVAASNLLSLYRIIVHFTRLILFVYVIRQIHLKCSISIYWKFHSRVKENVKKPTEILEAIFFFSEIACVSTFLTSACAIRAISIHGII